jgi:hypothetical protein
MVLVEDDPPRDVEAESGTFSEGFGRQEGFEDA